MKFITLLVLSLTPFSEAVFPLKQVLSKITASSSSSVADVQSTFEKAKSLLMTLPIEDKFQSFLETIPEKQSSISRALINLKSTMNWTSLAKSTSSTQWTMLMSSMAPIGLLENMICMALGKSLSFEQHTILRALMEEYQAVARVMVATMSLPQQYHKAIWMAYAASKVLPQRSILSLLVSSVVLARQETTSRTGVALTGMAVGLPLLFHGIRTIAAIRASNQPPVVELAECLLTPTTQRTVPSCKSLVRDNESLALQASLTSVPLNRLIGRRNTAATRPVVQFWRVGTSPQFWQGIYHAVKQDEYYCLLEDESTSKEPMALA